MAAPISAWGFGGVPSNPNPVFNGHLGELPQKYCECAFGLFFSLANCLPPIANKCRSPIIIYLLLPPVPLTRQELGRCNLNLKLWSGSSLDLNFPGNYLKFSQFDLSLHSPKVDLSAHYAFGEIWPLLYCRNLTSLPSVEFLSTLSDALTYLSSATLESIQVSSTEICPPCIRQKLMYMPPLSSPKLDLSCIAKIWPLCFQQNSSMPSVKGSVRSDNPWI